MTMMLVMLFVSAMSFGQVDSVTVNIQLETGINPDDLIDTVDVMKIDIDAYDTQTMSAMVAMVYEQDAENLVAMFKLTSADLQTQNLLSGNMVTLRVFDVDLSLNYRIELLVKNELGGNHPLITTNYDAE